MKVCISSGHGKHVPGACGIIIEHDEAVLVVNKLAGELEERGVEVETYEDTVSTTQSENLDRLVDWHNAQGAHELDISVHFNAYEQVTKPMGTEVLYVSQQALAAELSEAISSVGFINRGAKKRTDLAFLNGTQAPAVLLEICFVDSEADCELYEDQFDEICENIANVLGGDDEEAIDWPDRPEEKPDHDVLFQASGKCSHFGGPDDTGVSPSEGLAFLYDIMEAPHLFLPYQPEGTTGLARRLNPFIHYIACRWDYAITPKNMLAGPDRAMVRALGTGREVLAFPADWGPNANTNRVADLSPGLCEVLGVETDDEVEVIYPWPEG